MLLIVTTGHNKSSFNLSETVETYYFLYNLSVKRF